MERCHGLYCTRPGLPGTKGLAHPAGRQPAYNGLGTTPETVEPALSRGTTAVKLRGYFTLGRSRPEADFLSLIGEVSFPQPIPQFPLSASGQEAWCRNLRKGNRGKSWCYSHITHFDWGKRSGIGNSVL